MYFEKIDETKKLLPVLKTLCVFYSMSILNNGAMLLLINNEDLKDA
jgi:hypothetical protein